HIEKILMAIEIHGVPAIYQDGHRAKLREFYWRDRPAYDEICAELKLKGVPREDIEDLVKGDDAAAVELGARLEAESVTNGTTNEYAGLSDGAQSIDLPNLKRPEPDLSLLDDRRGDLPDFPADIFGGRCQEFLERSAHGAGVTFAHVAVPLLSIVSALLGTARRVQASRSWSQPCSVWASIVGNSGSGKTPGIDAVRRPLAQIERDNK